MKKITINIEDGISKERVERDNLFTTETKEALDSMKVGQSFIVKTETHRAAVIYYGRKFGIKFTSKKIYEGARKGINSPFHFRIWREPGQPTPIPDPKPRDYTKTKVKEFGSLTKVDVTDPANAPTDYAPKHALAEGVLEMAELRAENRKIVEDLEHIKRVLKEELKQDINWQPVRDNLEDES